MAKDLKKLLKNTRIVILIIFLIFALIAIWPRPFNTGVAIKSVVKNSAAFDAGLISPGKVLPSQYERILSINNVEIRDVVDYYDYMESLDVNQTLYIQTNRDEYVLTTRADVETVVLDELINKTVEVEVPVNVTVNGTNMTINQTVNQTILVNKTVQNVLGIEQIGIFVEDAPKSNIRLGLDLQGGTRVLLQPEKEISDDEMESVRDSMKQRIDAFGLSGVEPRIILDKPKALGGKPKYISVEIAGANVQEVKELLSKQGKFEAKIGDDVVFIGGEDISYVCRTAECSGLDTRNPTSQLENGTWGTGFFFTITITEDAAEKQAAATNKLSVITTTELGQPLPSEQQYLNDTIDLYLDNALVDSLRIGKGLKGNPVTDIQIAGSGFGNTKEQSYDAAIDNMKQLQTILLTGSLPIKMEIVKADNISPILGKQFTKNAFIVGLLAILTVVVILYGLYREIRIAVPIAITMLSEVILLLGFAALVGWNLDLAAIAGIIIAVGTGVDDQIVITSEVIERKGSNIMLTWREKIKNAFFIIMNSYFTTVVAMIPLLFAGAGLLKGFAFTTIFGVSFGVFIARPAFAAMMEHILKE